MTDPAKLIAEAVERLAGSIVAWRNPGYGCRDAIGAELLAAEQRGYERGKAEASAAEVESVETLCRVVIEAWQGRDTT